MRNIKLILIFWAILLIISSPLSAQTEKINPSNKFITQTHISISPILSPRICLGAVWAQKNEDQNWIELAFDLHGFHSEGLKNYGISAGYNYFWSGARNGCFTYLTAGFDYAYFTGFFYSPEPTKGRLMPNLSGGLGYSFRVSEKSFFRLSMDIGFKWFLSNLYFSFIW